MLAALTLAACAPDPWVVIGGGWARVTRFGADPVEVELPVAGPADLRYLAHHPFEPYDRVYWADGGVNLPTGPLSAALDTPLCYGDDLLVMVARDVGVDGAAPFQWPLCPELGDEVLQAEWHLDPSTATPLFGDSGYWDF